MSELERRVEQLSFKRSQRKIDSVMLKVAEAAEREMATWGTFTIQELMALALGLVLYFVIRPLKTMTPDSPRMRDEVIEQIASLLRQNWDFEPGREGQ
jgi:hypothetical protein